MTDTAIPALTIFEEILATNGATLDGRAELERKDIDDLRAALVRESKRIRHLQGRLTNAGLAQEQREGRRPTALTYDSERDLLVALCDDGTVWRHRPMLNRDNEWEPLPAIPQGFFR